MESFEGAAQSSLSGESHLAVEVAGLTKRFGRRTVLSDVSVAIPRGVGFGILGPNGAGKTTLLRTLLGLVRYSSGAMRIFGQPVPSELPALFRRIGAVVDEPGFLPHITGRQNLEMLAAARGDGASKRIDYALERAGLGANSDQKVAHYSTGMRQRLGVASCLIADPDLLILDESMNGLDPAGMQNLRTLMREHVASSRTLIFCSHLLDEVERACEMVAILDKGKVVFQGPIAQIRGQGTALVQIGCDDERRALSVLASVPCATEARFDHHEGIIVVLRAGCDPVHSAVEINRSLLGAGVAVHLIAPERPRLEDWFIELTRPGASTDSSPASSPEVRGR